MFGLLPARKEGKEYADSESASFGIIDEARGVDAYKSCMRVRPSEMTGSVA